MWWAQIGDWAAKAMDQFLGADQAHKANRTNIMLQRENRDWMEKMSNSAMQRHVMDLKAAGLNPAMGISSGGASTPVSQPARVSTVYQPGRESAMPRIAEALLMQATTAKTQAEARSISADASIKEANVPYSANNALVNARSIETAFDKLRHEAELKRIERLSESKAFEELQPLVIEYQRLVTRAAELGIPEAKATADFWTALEKEGKVAEFLRKLVGGATVIFKGK